MNKTEMRQYWEESVRRYQQEQEPIEQGGFRTDQYLPLLHSSGEYSTKSFIRLWVKRNGFAGITEEIKVGRWLTK
jgi:hypothetical protein